MTIREHMLVRTFARLGGSWWQREGQLRHLFGGTPTHVHAEYLALLERGDVEAAYPVEVHRARRMVAARKAARTGVGHPVGQPATR